MSNILAWMCAVLVSGLLIMLGINKFTNAPITMWIFHEMAVATGVRAFEPFGRVATGAAEILAGALIFPAAFLLWALGNRPLAERIQVGSAMLAIAVTMGALASHIAFLGIMTPDSATIVDGAIVASEEESPALFGMAVLLAVASAILVWLRRRTLSALRGGKA